ncbi:cell wall hydrolase [Tateyamaria omphalii]|uniref:Cell wall hydrolase n=1 Tax=Tateyamaria omphalii TaxID=299262 RepID=A0A1P8MSU2_9RHOB|nr:cell wall hydrolase [Tateyamaria omphalii]APX11108.1 cell wall hydrolase [Tateyamaria omphalii]
MRSLVKALLASCMLVGSPLAASETDEAAATGELLRAAEARGLRGVSQALLSDLLTPPAQPTDVSFSRSWLDGQPKAQGGAHWKCLSEALYFEARGETVKGQFAVAEVIMNRVRSARFPDNVCGVINQGTGRKYQCQFTYTCDGNPETIREPRAFERVSKVARAVLDGRAPDLTKGATHYHTTAVRPRWARVYTRTAAIGVHVFYRHTFRTASN